jgi:hypothetical protein
VHWIIWSSLAALLEDDMNELSNMLAEIWPYLAAIIASAVLAAWVFRQSAKRDPDSDRNEPEIGA